MPIQWLQNDDPLYKMIAGHDNLAQMVNMLADASVFNTRDGGLQSFTFEKGFTLAEKAAGRPVIGCRVLERAVFFIGTREEVSNRFKR